MIISLINQKGGVGKTTSAHNLAYALGEKNKKVLLIDFDPQGSMTRILNISNEALKNRKTNYEFILDDDIDINDILIPFNKFDFMPSTTQLTSASIQLIQSGDFNTKLREKLQPLKEDYDFIVIDAPPSLDVLSINVLCASDSVIIPVETNYLALEGLVLVLQTIGSVRDSINPELQIHTILPTKYEQGTLHHQDVLNTLKDDYGDFVFEPIKKSVQVADSSLEGMSMIEYNSVHVISQAYKKLAEVIING